jgi:glycerol-3-phosphate dehydrogenase
VTISPRSDIVRTLAAGVDVLVIGGGITGAGVALDAASRGYRVGLVERADYACGTSSRSTKLIHGGIRYLPQGHVGLVRDALRERTLLLRLAPHVARPLPFVVPLYASTRHPLGLRLPAVVRPFTPLGVRMGLFAYDLFARDPALRHRVVTRSTLAREVPELRTDGLRTAFVYYDARTDDVRLTHSVLATARAHGAVTLNYAAVRALTTAAGRVTGARVEDQLGGAGFDVPARFVVNATGIWAEDIAAMGGSPAFHIRHSKGVHLVLRPGALRGSMAIVIPETDDGRLAFIVPWADRWVLGTTDDAYAGDLDAVGATAADVAYLLDHANRYLTRPLEAADITGTFAGIRPLVAAAAGSTAALSRDHHLSVSPNGLVTITGGKLTTYRKMAEDTVDAIVALDGGRDGAGRPSRTATIPLAGSDGLAAAEAALGAAPLAADQRAYLLQTYGGAAAEIAALIAADRALAGRLVDGAPVTAAEVTYACRAEQALALVDCLYLRTKLAVLDAQAADGAAEAVTALMGRHLGWDAAEGVRQRARYDAVRARETAMRPGTAATVV